MRTRRFLYPVPIYDDGTLIRIDLIDEDSLEIVGSLAGVLRDEVSVDDGYIQAKLRTLGEARPGLKDSIAKWMVDALS